MYPPLILLHYFTVWMFLDSTLRTIVQGFHTWQLEHQGFLLYCVCSAHLVVSDQKQAHQGGVEDGLGDVCRLSLVAVLSHQGSTQGLTRPLHVAPTGSRHPSLLVILTRVYAKGILGQVRQNWIVLQLRWSERQHLHLQGQRWAGRDRRTLKERQSPFFSMNNIWWRVFPFLPI